MTTSNRERAAEQVFEARARALARPQTQAEAASGEECVLFQLGDACYSLPARAVLEVYPLARAAVLPGTPPWIVGLVNVRGRLMTALDLRPLLGQRAAAPAAQAHLLILSVQQVEVALLADAVLDVRPGGHELVPTLSGIAGQAPRWLAGVDRAGALHIDPTLLLADPQLSVNTTA